MAGNLHREIQGVQDEFSGIFHQETFASGSVLQYSTNVFVGTMAALMGVLEDVGMAVESDHVVVFTDIYSLGEISILQYNERIAQPAWCRT